MNRFCLFSLSVAIHWHVGDGSHSPRRLQRPIDVRGIHSIVPHPIAERSVELTEGCTRFYGHNGSEQTALPIGHDEDLHARIAEDEPRL